MADIGLLEMGLHRLSAGMVLGMVSFPSPLTKMTLQETGFHWLAVRMALRMVLPMTWFPGQTSLMASQ